MAQQCGLVDAGELQLARERRLARLTRAGQNLDGSWTLCEPLETRLEDRTAVGDGHR